LLPGIRIESRLAYPLNYSTALAVLAGIGLPLVLAATSSARTLAGQALAAAALPILALTMWLTGSSLALPLGVVGVGTFLVLAPDRLPKVGSLIAAGAGAAILIAAVEQRDALDRGLGNAVAEHQGDQMLAIVLIVCAGVALVQLGIALALRYGHRPSWLAISPSTARRAALLGTLILVVGATAAGLPGALSNRWDEFRSEGQGSTPRSTRGAQVLDVSSSGRYAFWRVAADAAETEPLLGIGPGTYEFWWGREGDRRGFVRDAHSLFIETLAELGIVGLLLIGGFCAAVLVIGGVRSLRSPPELRLGVAAATAGCAVFVGGVAVDWDWEFGTLAIAFVVLAAVAVAGGADWSTNPMRQRRSRWPDRFGVAVWHRYGARVVVIALAVVAIIAIAVPFGSASLIDDSREKARSGDLQGALHDAEKAADLQPYAATPRLQEALVLERIGDLDAAARSAREATRRESTNWRTWLILSRIEARRGQREAASAADRRATSLYTNFRLRPQ
jgi:hypothetical protein